MLQFFSYVTENALLLPLLLLVLGLPAFFAHENRGEDHKMVVCPCQTCNPEVFRGCPLAEKEICPSGMFICSSNGPQHPNSCPREELHWQFAPVKRTTKILSVPSVPFLSSFCFNFFFSS